MKKGLSVIGLLLVCSLFRSISAQDLHIYLNIEKNNEYSLIYSLKGDTLRKPKVRRGNHIFLHVSNYNNYLYDLDITSTQEEITYEGSSTFDLIELFNLASGVEIDPLSVSGGTGLLSLSGFDITALETALQKESDLKGYAYAENIRRIQEGLTEIENIESRVSEIRAKVDDILHFAALVDLAQADLEAIKVHPNWSPDDMKAQARKYMIQVFGTEDTEDIDAGKVLSRSRLKVRLHNEMMELKEVIKAFDRQVRQLEREASILADVRLKDELLRDIASSLTSFLERTPGLGSEFGTLTDELEQLTEQTDDLDITTLIHLQRNLEGIIKNDFLQTYRTVAEGDQINLSASFSLRDSITLAGGQRMLQLAPIPVPVYGGFKVNASVGISFGRFWDQPERYFVQNNIVQAEPGDQFLPVITSFFHFYWQGASLVSGGGSFGFGLPLVSSNENQSISFFLGPSLYLGRQSRFVFTTGLMGGRVTRLANGLQVGGTIDLGGGALPTYTPYELGYFLGLSFNLFAGGAG